MAVLHIIAEKKDLFNRFPEIVGNSISEYQGGRISFILYRNDSLPANPHRLGQLFLS